MIRNILLSLALFCSFACGSVDNGELFDEGDGGDEIGSVEQAFQSNTSTSGNLGVRTGASNIACDASTPGQTCVIPKNKAIRVFYTTSSAGSCKATAAQIQTVRSKVSAWFNAYVGKGMTGWTFAETSDISDPLITAVIDVQACATGACTSGTADQIERYSCFTGTTSGLTEDAGVVGNYVTFTGAPALHVDIADILARGANATEDDNLLKHAAFSIMSRGTLGLGNFDSGNALCRSRTLNSLTLSSACIVQGTEACLAKSFTETADTSHYGYTGTNCPLTP